MSLEDWKSQIKRGTLEFGILLLINKEPCYGYDIISRLDKWPIIAVKENTIYPLLRRLLKEKYLTSYWQESSEGIPPRKYYTITDTGKEYLSEMKSEWENLLSAMSDLEGDKNGKTDK